MGEINVEFAERYSANGQDRSKTMETDVFSYDGVSYSVRSDFPQITRLVELSKHSSILFLILGKTTSKSCNSSWLEHAQIG